MNPGPTIPLLAWPAALYRVAQDRIFEHLGHLPATRFGPAGNYLSGIRLGLGCAANGGAAYVVYHQNFFDPRTYAGLDAEPIAWLRLDELPRFNREVLPRIGRPFVLVTAESDWTAPSDFPAECEALVRSGKVRRWFAVNYDHRSHQELVTPLPLGLNYTLKHTLERSGTRPEDSYLRQDASPAPDQDAAWGEIDVAAPALEERVLRAFADFALNNSSRERRYGESRADIWAQLAGNADVVVPPRRLPRLELVRAYTRHAFVISPHGRGLDCYRTWEALRCGCIVIVKRSPLDPLYDGLPVAIVDDWREIDRPHLETWLARFGTGFDRTRLHRTLSHQYWHDEIRRAAAGT